MVEVAAPVSEVSERVVPQKLVDSQNEHYSGVWNAPTAPDTDTPQEGGESLVSEAFGLVSRFAQKNLPEPYHVLDVGSGRQIFGSRLTKRQHSKGSRQDLDYRLTSFDLAKIERGNLDHDASRHIRADGRQMPFTSSTFDLVVSDHALMFMGKEGDKEMARVLRPGGRALLRLDTPDIHDQQVKIAVASTYRQIAQENGLVFESEEQIREAYAGLGLKTLSVKRAENEAHIWWEVSLMKNHNPPLNRESNPTVFQAYEEKQVGTLPDLIGKRDLFDEETFRLLMDDELQTRRQRIDEVTKELQQLKELPSPKYASVSPQFPYAQNKMRLINKLGMLRQDLEQAKTLVAETMQEELTLLVA